MSASMPWALLLAWIGFFGCLNSHQRHAANFRGGSESFQAALTISVLLGSIVGVGLLGY